MKKVVINKGWFYGAGSVYGWKHNPSLHIFGVGISMDVLKANEQIAVDVGGEKFTLDCKRALSFVDEWRSVKTIKQRRIGVISKSILELK